MKAGIACLVALIPFLVLALAAALGKVLDPTLDD